jgi:hypothetical protein
MLLPQFTIRSRDVRVGSKTEVAALRRDVCFAPVSGHRRGCHGVSLILLEMPNAQAARTSKSVSAPVHPSIAR